MIEADINQANPSARASWKGLSVHKHVNCTQQIVHVEFVAPLLQFSNLVELVAPILHYFLYQNNLRTYVVGRDFCVNVYTIADIFELLICSIDFYNIHYDLDKDGISNNLVLGGLKKEKCIVVTSRLKPTENLWSSRWSYIVPRCVLHEVASKNILCPFVVIMTIRYALFHLSDDFKALLQKCIRWLHLECIFMVWQNIIIWTRR